MAVYTTIDKLKKRTDPRYLAMISDDTSGQIKTQADAATALADPNTVAILDQHIDDASRTVDAELVGRVDMTIAANQTAVERYTADICLYFLHRRRYMDGADNKWTSSYEAALKWLRQVREGQILLAIDDETPAAETVSNVADQTRRINLDGFNPFVGGS